MAPRRRADSRDGRARDPVTAVRDVPGHSPDLPRGRGHHLSLSCRPLRRAQSGAGQFGVTFLAPPLSRSADVSSSRMDGGASWIPRRHHPSSSSPAAAGMRPGLSCSARRRNSIACRLRPGLGHVTTSRGPREREPYAFDRHDSHVNVETFVGFPKPRRRFPKPLTGFCVRPAGFSVRPSPILREARRHFRKPRQGFPRRQSPRIQGPDGSKLSAAWLSMTPPGVMRESRKAVDMAATVF